ncbi:L-type lectin-domain containing receptor kinase IV.2-like [Cryptomeria japonica]|uniref:L-type lectin-domain containing receptor kinase IV.2-like n=1 Tax=Cryptomeria japonica TaxID=3369 RepID=UPI0027D9F9B4|nr:L-type lectin-domain containing receptor kinase IV.2-like [Cryptomeria japonica]
MALLVFAFLIFFFVGSNAQLRTSFLFNEFNESGLILLQSASIKSNVLRLTDQSMNAVGRALFEDALHLKTNNSISSFSTTFVFSIVPATNNPGHGLTFLISPYRSAVSASEIGYIGLLNASSDGREDNHLFAVEFDTHLNHWNNDIDANHVGVDLNTINSSVSKTAGYEIGEQFEELKMASGQNIQAWIDYDGHQHNLNVTIALAGMARPLKPLISMQKFDLGDIFKEEMYVGFSAATGRDAVEDHYILAWSFSTDAMAQPLDLLHLPSFIPKTSRKPSVGLIVGVFMGSLFLVVMASLVACYWSIKRNLGDAVEEWEVEFWPHRIPYQELRTATDGFSDERLLGSGGFGKVYRGTLPSTGLEVAIKHLTRDLHQGMKDFVAEISSLGRLQHRNLVRLQGWCRHKNQLFVVYDYMPNRSLDRFIFGNPETVLGWSSRYSILKGVATGLLYLHQEWEWVVVHRDLKSQNILLDSQFNAKLGDFGLARLHDHTQKAPTSGIAGTLGYIAPEIIATGKATVSTDVFSFGIVLLEVACGRWPVDESAETEKQILVEWVRKLYVEERIMEAVDTKLGGQYNGGEMERVLKLGVLCSHPQPECRPDMKQVLQILDGQAPIPLVHIAAVNRTFLIPEAKELSGAKCSVNSAGSSPLTARYLVSLMLLGIQQGWGRGAADPGMTTEYDAWFARHRPVPLTDPALLITTQQIQYPRQREDSDDSFESSSSGSGGDDEDMLGLEDVLAVEGGIGLVGEEDELQTIRAQVQSLEDEVTRQDIERETYHADYGALKAERVRLQRERDEAVWRC